MSAASKSPAMEAPVQAVIVPGLRGIHRRDDATAALRDVGGRPFVDYLVEDCVRFGFHDLLLLAPEGCDAFESYATEARKALRSGVRLEVAACELKDSADRLRSSFLLLDAECHFDFNWLDLMLDAGAGGVVAARERGASVDAGIYLAGTGAFPAAVDLRDVSAARRAYHGALADIRSGRGLATLPQRRRPAVFFDRDGTINVDTGYVHRPEDLVFVAGAIAAIKRANDLGYFAFLVTNQSGVGRGFFTAAAVDTFHAHLQRHLRAAGAHLDDIRYCPDRPDATAPSRPGWRKPAPGMLLDLLGAWPVIAEQSLVVGDKPIDVEAALNAGLKGLRFSEGDLDRFLAPHLPAESNDDLPSTIDPCEPHFHPFE